MKVTIYLSLAESDEAESIEIRSVMNHALLGVIGRDGLYYWERRSRTRHLLPWSEILKQYEEKQGVPLQKFSD